ncbi:MAG: hypothetical protein PF447_01700 [Spirochaetaceae bacterium]|jgi:hypothetical protein|nr:hypothetical protein [Spirochaetaceae bacterium]
MIDTLNIDFGNNIRVDNPDLVVTSSRASYHVGAPVHESHLWTDPQKGIITGESAYFRHNKAYPFDISYRRWRDGKMHFLVCTSVPQLLDGVNLRSINSSDFGTYLSVLKDKLTCIGIDIDPLAGRIARIDLFKQGKMNADFGVYAELFNQFNIPRTDMQKAETSYLWKNRLSNDWAINVYDKGIQMKSDNPTHKLLRLEVQLRRIPIIEQVLGFTSIRDLKEHFNDLPKIFECFLEKRFLLHNAVLVGKHALHERSVLDELLENHRHDGGLRWADTFFRDLGIAWFCESLGFDNALSLVSASGKNLSSTERSRNSRLASRMRDALFLYRVANEGRLSKHGEALNECFNHLKQIIRS